MRIQHNIMAMNAYRNYNTNTSALAKNLEKLSSGYKINRAGDDAAGLAISEKMRAQITGLNAAQKNVKDGISLVKTAEGAMQEIQDMLNRMDYLATQSANGTYDDPVDRLNLQKEVTALKSEINRIADSANFNGIKLLDGSLGEGTSSTSVEGLADVAFASKKDAVIKGVDAQAGKWSLDLSQLKFTSQTNVDTAVTVTIGGLTLGTFKVASTTTDSDKVTYSYSDLKDFDIKVGETKIGNISVNVSFDEDTGKITIEQLKAPTTTKVGDAAGVLDLTAQGASLEADGDVSFNVNLGTAIGGVPDKKLQLTTEKASIGPGPERQYASASFTLATGDIKDGMTFKIGNETYTFAVGMGSKFKDGSNVVDLTDVDKDNVQAADVAKAIERLSAAAKDNKQFYVGIGEVAGQINLVEKEGSGLDYLGSQIVGEKNVKADGTPDDDAKWKGIVQKGQGAVSSSAGGGLRLQIGDTADQFNQMSVIVGDMHVKAMGKGKTTLDGKEIDVTKTVADVDISNQEGAAEAIGIIKNAINYVSGIRGDLGAVQNRLDHTAKNLSVMAENIQDAESTIRDTDVAEEMMAYTKNNILIQSAQAMLAQANAVPQGVLQLLG